MSGKTGSPRTIDIELTNSCNIACSFCPRSKTPARGLLELDTFQRAAERALEQSPDSRVQLCGLGEPLLHPRVVDFVAILSDLGLTHGLTTNGTLLTRELSTRLVDAGLQCLTVSVSDLDEGFRVLHGTSFERVRDNVLTFLEVAEGRCRTKISVTVTSLNQHRIGEIQQYWRERGITEFVTCEYANRGGALELNRSFVRDKWLYREAERLLEDSGITSHCMAPFFSVFVGWNGNYYMCCHDYTKQHPLATVFEHDVLEVDAMKRRLWREVPEICWKCNQNVINQIREMLGAVEQGSMGSADLHRRLVELRETRGPGMTEALPRAEEITG